MGTQDHFTRADILADLADMLPGRSRRIKLYRTVGLVDHLFHHDHSVAAIRHRIACIHHGIVFRAQHDRSGLGSAEGDRRSESDAVHGARKVMGRADVGIHGGRCHSSVSFKDRNCFLLRTKPLLLQSVQELFPGIFQRQIGEILKCHFSFSFKTSIYGI